MRINEIKVGEIYAYGVDNLFCEALVVEKKGQQAIVRLRNNFDGMSPPQKVLPRELKPIVR